VERWPRFGSEWQSFRTRRDLQLDLTTTGRIHERTGRCTVADIFGNHTMTLVPVDAGSCCRVDAVSRSLQQLY